VIGERTDNLHWHLRFDPRRCGAVSSCLTFQLFALLISSTAAPLAPLPRGKSGSVFYISHDDRFIIKTMRKHEMSTLRAMLPRYHQHLLENSDSLLKTPLTLYP